MQDFNPTPYPALNGLLQELVEETRQVLGSNFTGAYLQGSLAIGDFDQNSDVDFGIVIEDDLTPAQVADLQEMHLRIYRLGGKYPPDIRLPSGTLPASKWETSLEGSYYPKDRLKRCDLASAELWYLDNGASELIRNDHDDNLVSRWTLRERGVVLAGPDPKTLIEPIPTDGLRREILKDMAFVVGDFADSFWNSAFGQPYAVLSFCRMLLSINTGQIHSKRAGSLWAEEALDQEWIPLIRQAWAARGTGHVSQPADEGEYAKTILFINYCREQGNMMYDEAVSCETVEDNGLSVLRSPTALVP